MRTPNMLVVVVENVPELWFSLRSLNENLHI